MSKISSIASATVNKHSQATSFNMADQDKKNRGLTKAKVTRQVNRIIRFMAEKKIDIVKQQAQSLENIFIEFEEAHAKVHDLIEDLDEMEISDKHFYDVQDNYVSGHKLVTFRLCNKITNLVSTYIVF